MNPSHTALQGLGLAIQCKEGCIGKEIGNETSQRNNKPRRRIKMKRFNASVGRVTVVMNEIRREQESIRRGLSQVREKFESVQFECEQLRKETDLVTKQSSNTQLRLALMFQILGARESNDFNKAAILTQILRELIAKQNNQ